MKNKITSFLLTVFISFCMLPSLFVAGESKTVYSCGFEGNSKKEWYASEGWGSEFCEIIKEPAYLLSGSCAAHLSHKTTEESVYITKTVAVTGGYTYQLEINVKAEVNGGNGFKLEALCAIDDVNKNVVASFISDKYYSTNNKFQKITMEIVPPENANKLLIRPRLYGKGDVYIDDILLTETQGPEPFVIQTSHVFHYDDEKHGTVTVNLNPFYGGESEEATCKAYFKIMDGSVVVKEETLPFKSNVAVFTYEVSKCLKQLKKQYKLLVQVKKPDGTIVEEYSQNLYLFKRPSRINEKGEYILNGKVFNPVFAYHVDIPTDTTPDENNAFLQAKKAGINVVTIGMGECRMISAPEKVHEAIRQLEKYDLYGIFTLYSSHMLANGKVGLCSAAGCENEIKNTQMMAEALKDEKRVFAWMIMDEPFGTGQEVSERSAELEKAYYEIRIRDSLHPVWICDFNLFMFEEDLKYCDVFAPDKYTKTEQIVFDSTTAALEKAKTVGNKPVYPLVGAYVNKTNTTLITPERLRYIIYEGIIAGADGIGIYAFSDCIHEEMSPTGKAVPIYNTDVWPMVLELGKELPILFEKVTRKPFVDESTAKYYMRHYGELTVIIPFGTEAQTVTVPQKFGPAVLFGGEAGLLRNYKVQMDPMTPVLLEYGHAWCVLKDGKMAKTLSAGTHTIQYAGEDADLVAALYYPNGELYKIFAKKNATALVVTVPEGEYTLSAFAFSSGSLRPLAEKFSL